MKQALLLMAGLLFASALAAQDMDATVDQTGDKVILLPNHTWRYDDAGGKRCTSVGPKAKVCALPSAWTPVPGDRGFEPQWFEKGSDFKAVVWMLGGPETNVAMTPDTVKRFINGDRGTDSDHGLTAEETLTELVGLRPITVSSVTGSSATRVYSYVALNDGSVLLAVTVEDPSFQYSFSHRTAHKDFLDAIRIEGLE